MVICSEKKTFISSSIEICCSSNCVTVFDDILNKKLEVENFFRSKITLDCGFCFAGSNKEEKPL